MKIVTILGARPQFIKAGSVSRAILDRRLYGENISETIVHTGQHYDQNMSNIFFDEMEIPKPGYALGIGGKSHGSMTGQMIEKIEEVLLVEKPDWVMVYGDTNSTLAGALAASKLNIKIAHVEAGLRSFNMKMPEEVNRILTDRISTLLFCPSKTAVTNLNKEGFSHWNQESKIILSGDVMYDGAKFYADKSIKPNSFDTNDKYVLATIHRAENTDNYERLKGIIKALNSIGENRQVILPLHPRTKKILINTDLNIENLTLVEPLGYKNMVWLIKNASIVVTDSGGLQKEAYFFSVPCITCRDETEWTELVDIGVNILSGAQEKKIIDSYNLMINSNKLDFMNKIYGDGKASEAIIDGFLNNLK
jgi:UDP-GlcNAc3NAcA epimerase